MNTLDKIKVMRAYVDGADVQYKRIDGTWDKASTPCWNWRDREYRIKSKPVKQWVNVYEGGALGANYDTKEDAEQAANGEQLRTILMREVEGE